EGLVDEAVAVVVEVVASLLEERQALAEDTGLAEARARAAAERSFEDAGDLERVDLGRARAGIADLDAFVARGIAGEAFGAGAVEAARHAAAVVAAAHLRGAEDAVVVGLAGEARDRELGRAGSVGLEAASHGAAHGGAAHHAFVVDARDLFGRGEGRAAVDAAPAAVLHGEVSPLVVDEGLVDEAVAVVVEVVAELLVAARVALGAAREIGRAWGREGSR